MIGVILKKYFTNLLKDTFIEREKDVEKDSKDLMIQKFESRINDLVLENDSLKKQLKEKEDFIEDLADCLFFTGLNEKFINFTVINNKMNCLSIISKTNSEPENKQHILDSLRETDIIEFCHKNNVEILSFMPLTIQQDKDFVMNYLSIILNSPYAEHYNYTRFINCLKLEMNAEMVFELVKVLGEKEGSYEKYIKLKGVPLPHNTVSLEKYQKFIIGTKLHELFSIILNLDLLNGYVGNYICLKENALEVLSIGRDKDLLTDDLEVLPIKEKRMVI